MEVYRNGRAVALSKGLERPWDLAQHNIEKESRLVVDKERLVNELDHIAQSANFTWVNMEHMEMFDNVPYEKFKDSLNA